ncbi:MAG: hypothetical protein M9894_17125 [Planctomycetes bacterium]|nr:hypothetical protein [Planctomycetota bacterium]
MPDLRDRLAVVALRTVLEQLEADPTGAAELLGDLFADRDVKPQNVLAHDAPDDPDPPAPPEPDEPEAARHVRALVARFGDVEAAAAETGFALGALERWLAGGPITASALFRLRAAAEAPRSELDLARARAREEARAADQAARP